MINPSSIQQITDACRIEEVVGWFVNLKKRGTSLTGLCPFHNEKTPSFHVSAVKGIYKCFGCGKGGDSVQFMMDHEKFSYPEALRFLAEKYQIPIEESGVDADYARENDDRESLFILNNYAREFFSQNLNEPEGKTIGSAYFFERGFREETIQKFDLGYALASKNHFSKKALDYGFKPEFLISSGLSFALEDGSLMDRFRGRVLFPIHNLSGKVIAFGGRILNLSEKVAKYINSPESDLYHKSEVLYGIFQAKKAIRDFDVCLLAEGYTDVISLHQSGIENVVASSGTSLTKPQIKLISRFTQNIVILYDGDPAGIKASIRGIDLILEEGLFVKIVLFPDNQDPDSYIRSVGGTAFSEYVKKHQKDFIAFKTDLLLEEAQGDPIKKSSLVHDILETISKIPDSVLATVYTHECSERLQMDERILLMELNKIRLNKSKSAVSEQNQRQVPTSNSFPIQGPGFQSSTLTPPQEIGPLLPLKDDEQEEELLRLLINYGNSPKEEGLSVAQDIITQIQDIEFENPLFLEIFHMIVDQIEVDKKLDVLPLIQSRKPSVKNLVVNLLSEKYTLSDNWKDRHGIDIKKEEDLIQESVENCINHLKRRKLDFLIKQNQDKMKTASPEEQTSLLSIHLIYSNARSNLSVALGVVVLK